MNDYIIRKFHIEDAEDVSALIAKTMRTTNSKDYSDETIENTVSRLTPANICERSKWTHFYVVCNYNKIIGCGAIGPYWGREDESSLFNIFVLPEYQGKGVGRMIIQTLERDEYFTRANRIEVPASITAEHFYLKLGYRHKNGVRSVDDEQHVAMEKLRQNI